MKSFLITLFQVLIIYLTGSCQNYTSVFGINSARWDVCFIVPDAGLTESLYTSGDTILQGKNYKIIKDEWQGNQGYLREDSILGKTWFYDAIDSEKVIMDLSLQLGDTFNVNIQGYPNNFIADSIYFLSGLKRVRLINSDPFSSDILIFIEGIGPDWGLRYQSQSVYWQHDPQLSSKYTDSTQVYTTTNYNGSCYMIMTAVNKIEQAKNELNFFPNPVNKNERVSLDIEEDEIYQVVFYNVNGSIALVEHSKGFDLNLPIGLYFTNVITKSGKIYYNKLVVKE